MLFRSLPTARDAFDMFAAHSGLAHDVNDTGCCGQNGSPHGRVLSAFRLRFFTNEIGNKVTRNTAVCRRFWCVFIDRACAAFFPRFPFNRYEILTVIRVLRREGVNRYYVLILIRDLFTFVFLRPWQLLAKADQWIKSNLQELENFEIPRFRCQSIVGSTSSVFDTTTATTAAAASATATTTTTSSTAAAATAYY